MEVVEQNKQIRESMCGGALPNLELRDEGDPGSIMEPLFIYPLSSLSTPSPSPHFLTSRKSFSVFPSPLSLISLLPTLSLSLTQYLYRSLSLSPSLYLPLTPLLSLPFLSLSRIDFFTQRHHLPSPPHPLPPLLPSYPPSIFVIQCLAHPQYDP